jgi:hypothetical protein
MATRIEAITPGQPGFRYEVGFSVPLRFAAGMIREEAAVDAVVRHFVV